MARQGGAGFRDSNAGFLPAAKLEKQVLSADKYSSDSSGAFAFKLQASAWTQRQLNSSLPGEYHGFCYCAASAGGIICTLY